MLRLSKKSDYALLALRHLAVPGSRHTASARELAETYALPPELLAKVLQQLVRGGLLVSVQGIRGGYGLAKPAAQITVVDVIEAIDGPMTVTACSEQDQSCDQYTKCNIRDPLWKLKDRIVSALAATTVAELAAEMPSATPNLISVSSIRTAPSGAAERR